MNEGYFVVILKDGTIKDFNKECNYFEEFGNLGQMISFMNCAYPTTKRLALSVISVDNILSIDRHIRDEFVL